MGSSTQPHRSARGLFAYPWALASLSPDEIASSAATTRSNSSTIRFQPRDVKALSSSLKYQIWSPRPRLNRSQIFAPIWR